VKQPMQRLMDVLHLNEESRKYQEWTDEKIAHYCTPFYVE